MVTDIGRFYLHANCPSLQLFILEQMHCAQKKLKIFFSFLYVKVKEFPFMKLEHYIMQTKQDNVFCLSADYRLGLWLIFLRGFIFFDAIWG